MAITGAVCGGFGTKDPVDPGRANDSYEEVSEWRVVNLMCDHCGCRNFGPIAELTADHVDILELAWRVGEGQLPDEAARQAGREELNTLLRMHALKEETGLYPLLSNTGDLSREQCKRLEAEHRDMHRLLERAEFDRRSYYALAAHIEEEELELFSGAMFAFDDDDWEAMDRANHAAVHRFGVPHSHGADA